MVQRQSTLLYIRFRIQFQHRPFCKHTTYNEQVLLHGGNCERVTPASNVLEGGCWQLKRKLPPAASSNRLQSLQSAAACTFFEASFYCPMENTNTSLPSRHYFVRIHTSKVLHPPSNPHLVRLLFQVGLRIILSCIALSNLDLRPNERTFRRDKFLKSSTK